ncbi:hypothetical protein BDV38DRAFT_243170 [Aspergillus pseudotamarii]|uniref:Uncharacterized protein n=1 Tax=Aspergillus pseudotamarii TaxID=132259 RepID=A0A5N6SZD8_ASPPS|nr:uncharacterized protein BDV38DRAFT_243170 [Aspergillus pseudotamarii]KAE8139277.1 hypothetical protein BDV38DRAFT_243170 [Aspergillus pseudotamarii]
MSQFRQGLIFLCLLLSSASQKVLCPSYRSIRSQDLYANYLPFRIPKKTPIL